MSVSQSRLILLYLVNVEHAPTGVCKIIVNVNSHTSTFLIKSNKGGNWRATKMFTVYIVRHGAISTLFL